jgi:hypothetical protein
MSSTLAGLPVNRLGKLREFHPQHLPSRVEGSSNAVAASCFREPGRIPDERKKHTMLSKLKKVGLGVAALSGAAFGGAAVAGAATSHSGTTTGSPPPPARNIPAPGTAAHEDNEKEVTGDAATKAKAAALKAAGGTAGDVTTDYFGTGYEVTVTKSDGTEVEIHLDSSFNVTGAPGGRLGGPPTAQPSGTFN